MSWFRFLSLVTATALASCGDGPPEACVDAGVIGYRNGRVDSHYVSCPGQCPTGTRAVKRGECIWDCSMRYSCIPESTGGDAGTCEYTGGRGRNTIGVPGSDPRCSPRD